jgi:serine/threonine-protein kinase
MTVVAGQLIERYRVEERLGEGGTAVVYRVRHVHLGTEHALKLLTLLGSQGAPRLLLVGRVQAALRHPNVVAVTDVLEVDGTWALLLEYVPPPSLAVWITESRPGFEEAERVFRGIVEGVRHAHTHGLVHRDLKPANVLLAQVDGQWVPKVADFGLARLLDEDGPRHTRSGLAMGTPQYMAPEQFRDAKGVDRRADLFSLGCILHELVSGTPAFAWTDLIAVHNAMVARTWAPLPPGVPARLRSAIAGCLEPERDLRIPDCATLLAVLDGQTRRGPTLVPGRAALAGLEPGGGVAAPSLRSAETWVPRPIVRADPHAPTVVDGAGGMVDSASTLVGPSAAAPSTGLRDTFFARAPAEAPRPPDRRARWAAGTGLVLLAALGGAQLLRSSETPETPPAATPAPVAPAPLATTVPEPAVPPSTPEPLAASRTPTRTSKPLPSTTPAVPPPSPAVSAASAPVAPVPAPAPARTDAAVHSTGARTVLLEGSGGRFPVPGHIPPGHYRVWADFGAGPTDAGVVDLVAGDDVALACSDGFQTCTVHR